MRVSRLLEEEEKKEEVEGKITKAAIIGSFCRFAACRSLGGGTSGNNGGTQGVGNNTNNTRGPGWKWLVVWPRNFLSWRGQSHVGGGRGTVTPSIFFLSIVSLAQFSCALSLGCFSVSLRRGWVADLLVFFSKRNGKRRISWSRFWERERVCFFFLSSFLLNFEIRRGRRGMLFEYSCIVYLIIVRERYWLYFIMVNQEHRIRTF